MFQLQQLACEHTDASVVTKRSEQRHSLLNILITLKTDPLMDPFLQHFGLHTLADLNWI